MSALALAIGVVGAGSVSPASAAAAPNAPRAVAGEFMLQSAATGACLTATSAGYGFAGVVALGCNRNNNSQWWAPNQDKLEEANFLGTCLVNQNGQAGTEDCNVGNPHWWYGSNPSVVWSTSGGYLTSSRPNVWLGSNQGSSSQWVRVY
ncbi:RICIN domain-containing protein [Kitasatospora sp. NBC_01287]|uniref:ricin-type beta-trefoil lectin domain protein n=1 Tax=Kitasatospora sp. NBC_01287 TaxID=2903573 RepID=UPI00224CB5AF|nr:ricin-type beta-trefoil lectin domain protein [Kitasatospora sp. NBC_01287]MCX4743930.1 RICIN domain-containing protein [Kitasatospora sp. NBC_01287]